MIIWQGFENKRFFHFSFLFLKYCSESELMTQCSNQTKNDDPLTARSHRTYPNITKPSNMCFEELVTALFVLLSNWFPVVKGCKGNLDLIRLFLLVLTAIITLKSFMNLLYLSVQKMLPKS